MTRSLALAISVSLLCAAGAAACFHRMRELRGEGQWLLAYGGAQADAYVRSFEGKSADAQLSTFSERRRVLERSMAWQRGAMILLLGAVTGALCAYFLFLINRLEAQLTVVTAEGGVPLEVSREAPPAKSPSR
jgi:hypothetical protein